MGNDENNKNRLSVNSSNSTLYGIDLFKSGQKDANCNNQYDSPDALPSSQGLLIKNVLKTTFIDLLNDNQDIQNNPLKMKKDTIIPDINSLLDSSIPNENKLEFNEMVNDISNNLIDTIKKEKNAWPQNFPPIFNSAYDFSDLNGMHFWKKLGRQNINIPSFYGIAIDANDGNQINNLSIISPLNYNIFN